MNKKIVLSLATIAAVGAVAVGGTIAQFSDSEKATGTFTAGTIDIAVDGQNPWSARYTTGDLKPGQTGYINFDIQNVGQNGVKVSKSLSNFVESTGIVSEPECTDQGGTWDNANKACDWSTSPTHDSTSDKNNVQSKIIYDLYVEVYKPNETEKAWWQTLYTDEEGKSLSDVYGESGGGFVNLGTIPAGGHMIVKQSYHFAASAGNEYQGDILAFDMTVTGDQLPQGEEGKTTVALENKKEDAGIWNILEGDNIEGALEYVAQGPLFDYSFTGKVRTTGNYTLLYVGNTNNYPCVGSIVLGADNFTALTAKTITGQVEIGADVANGKIWLIPTSSYAGGVMTSWPADDILFETGMINYVNE